MELAALHKQTLHSHGDTVSLLALPNTHTLLSLQPIRILLTLGAPWRSKYAQRNCAPFGLTSNTFATATTFSSNRIQNKINSIGNFPISQPFNVSLAKSKRQLVPWPRMHSHGHALLSSRQRNNARPLWKTFSEPIKIKQSEPETIT